MKSNSELMRDFINDNPSRKQEIADLLFITVPALYNKLADEDGFGLEEIGKLQNIGVIPGESLSSIEHACKVEHENDQYSQETMILLIKLESYYKRKMKEREELASKYTPEDKDTVTIMSENFYTN